MKTIVKTITNPQVINCRELYATPKYLGAINNALKLSKYSDYTKNVYYPMDIILSITYLKRGRKKVFINL
jgi:hypothetical protein